MKENQELYAALDYENYKNGKSNILNSQACLLNIMKHIEVLKNLKKQKIKLKIYLNAILKETSISIENLQAGLPKTKMPKITIEKKQAERKEVHSEKYLSINKELQEIQEKLKALNS